VSSRTACATFASSLNIGITTETEGPDIGGHSRTEGALARALERYKAAPFGERLFLRGRAFLADLAAVERRLPARGLIVDLGCGRGLLANLLVEASPDREVVGIEPDARRVAIARLTERPRLRFESGDAIDAVLPPCDAVAIVDVLYLLPPDAQARVLGRAAEAVQPGGRVVVYAQERRADPRYWFGYAQEMIATGTGLTRGHAGLHYSSREEMSARMERAGLAVTVDQLRGRAYTDAVYVGEKR
jgi:SAM-dependent methyltransferase